MKYDEVSKDGSDATSAKALLSRPLAALLVLLLASVCNGQALYKYRGENGEWIFSDRPPVDQQIAEVRTLEKGVAKATVTVFHEDTGEAFRFIAQNSFHSPVEVILALDGLTNLSYPAPEQGMRWVVPARSELLMMQLSVVDTGFPAGASYRYVWLHGDPSSKHEPTEPYRAPFSVASGFRISQAYPLSITHVTPDSYQAVDVAMPIGTDIYAARGGRVFEVASRNFRGGLEPGQSFSEANLVRILHDDGTHAVYAHLNWNSIRVKPGDLVKRGEYIAESGNTGFTSGPHLHFAVIRNKGMALESVPVVFEGPNSAEIVPQAGDDLTAY